MTTNTSPTHYHAYLLRLWQIDGDHNLASLQDVMTNRRIGFASLEELFAFLMQIMENQPSSIEPLADHHLE